MRKIWVMYRLFHYLLHRVSLHICVKYPLPSRLLSLAKSSGQARQGAGQGSHAGIVCATTQGLADTLPIDEIHACAQDEACGRCGQRHGARHAHIAPVYMIETVVESLVEDAVARTHGNGRQLRLTLHYRRLSTHNHMQFMNFLSIRFDIY